MTLKSIPGGKGQGSSGGGPNDPELELRVSLLELKFSQIADTLQRIESALKELSTDNREFRNQLMDLSIKLAGVEGRITGIEGRLSGIPSTWHIVAILATLLFGVSGIVFAASKFYHP